jgi:capsular polysaccharide biosynthesis protein/Mrp family chromosome partitioning ATPase
LRVITPSASPDVPESEDSPLRGYLTVLSRHRWLALTLLVLTPLAAFVLTSTQQASYSASADVLTDRLSFPVAGGDATDAERAAATQEKLARVPAVAQRVVDAERRDLTAREFLDRSSVSAATGADLLTFTVRDPDRDQAMALATAYAREFTRYRQELASGTIAQARAGLERRIRRLAAAGRAGSPLYRALTASDEQLARIQAIPQQGAVVVQPAVDAAQVAPQTTRNTMLGIGLGILLAIGAAFLADALDNRVRSSGEVSRLLRAPILAEVPRRRQPPRRGAAHANGSVASAPAADAIRMLRTSFDLARSEGGARTVMFSSVDGLEQQNASTVAELAVALARAGRNVVLCDFDSRSPVLGDLFEIDGRPGVSDVAAGRAALHDVLVPVAVASPTNGASAAENGSGSLRFLPLGPRVPGDPGDFVGQPAVAETLAAVARDAEVVLVNAPPLLEASDAMALSGSVEGIVLLTDLRNLDRGRVAAVERTLEATSRPVLGIVVLDSAPDA